MSVIFLPGFAALQELEAESAARPCHLAELQRAHEEERKKARRYLHALEQDNEVLNCARIQ